MSTDAVLANQAIDFPTERTELTLSGAVGPLEVVVDVPEPDELSDDAVAIICHGLPATGGSVYGRVTHLIDKSLRQLGLRTIRFNFRSVGDSAGEHDNGDGETDDLLLVGQWVKQHFPQAELWLAGYDFGSYVTARAATELACKHLIAVAPPVAQFDFGAIDRPPCHWLVIHGDEDEHTPIDAVQSWVDESEDPPHLIVMTEAGHKFHRRLMDLRGVIKNGVRRVERLAEESAAS